MKPILLVKLRLHDALPMWGGFAPEDVAQGGLELVQEFLARSVKYDHDHVTTSFEDGTHTRGPVMICDVKDLHHLNVRMSENFETIYVDLSATLTIEVTPVQDVSRKR